MLDDTDTLGYVGPVRRFLASVGLHGKEQAFLFCMGFLSALAISRVRLTVMAILPASAFLFAVGVSVGVAQGGASLADLMNRGGRGKCSEKIEFLVGFLDDLESNMAELNSGLEGSIRSSRLRMEEVKRYLGVVESVRSAALPAKKLIMEYLDGSYADEPAAIEGAELERKTSPKGLNRKKKEAGVIGYDVIRLFGGLLEESFMLAKSSKAKDSPTKETTVQSNTFDKGQDGLLQQSTCVADASEGNTSTLIRANFEGSAKSAASTGGLHKTSTNWDLSPERVRGNTQDVAVKSEDGGRSEIPGYAASKKQGEPYLYGSMSNMDDGYDSKECGQRDTTVHLNNRNRSSQSSFFQYKAHREEIEFVENKFHGSSGRERDSDSRETEELHTFSGHESSTQLNSTTYSHSNMSVNEEKIFGVEMHTGSSTKNGVSEIISTNNQKPLTSSVEIGIASSSAITADDEFHQNLKEAGDLLNQAKECLKRENNEDTAEIILSKSARLLSTAVALKPMSLLAVGQLGNTFLLHGELKLKTTRELRIILLENDNSVIGRKNRSHLKALIDLNSSKDAVLSALVDTCEECEELLVDAGRMYKKALSIDSNDVRALYNWGLALTYRAQLIGDIGPEAAVDADKIYLAAINKFAAMTSRSNKYAPDALFRWGLALQERSYLHLYDIRLKRKLLKQAKSMYEDVLRVDRNNPIVREALFSCISELNRQFQ